MRRRQITQEQKDVVELAGGQLSLQGKYGREHMTVWKRQVPDVKATSRVRRETNLQFIHVLQIDHELLGFIFQRLCDQMLGEN